MKVEQAIDLYITYLTDNKRPNTVRSFSFTLLKFKEYFNTYTLDSIKEADIIEFITKITERKTMTTKCSRVGVIRALYNFILEITDASFQNPCQRPMIKKLFKKTRSISPTLLDKDIIDEIIFRTTNERDRLILELMGRAGMRIGEVLNIHCNDIDFNSATIIIQAPKSGRMGEKVYVTKKLCNKLYTFIQQNNLKDRIFNISYSTAYRLVRKSGTVVSSFLRPHDLRRHAATQASRSGIPLEIVSKVILRHADIATTQRYLGTIDPSEASRWVEHLNR